MREQFGWKLYPGKMILKSNFVCDLVVSAVKTINLYFVPWTVLTYSRRGGTLLFVRCTTNNSGYCQWCARAFLEMSSRSTLPRARPQTIIQASIESKIESHVYSNIRTHLFMCSYFSFPEWWWLSGDTLIRLFFSPAPTWNVYVRICVSYGLRCTAQIIFKRTLRTISKIRIFGTSNLGAHTYCWWELLEVPTSWYVNGW